MAHEHDPQKTVQELMVELQTVVRRVAISYMNQGDNRHQSLQASSILQQAFVKLLEQRNLQVTTKDQFLAAAATIIRRLLIDHARKRGRRRDAGVLPGRGQAGEDTTIIMPEAGVQDRRIDVLDVEMALEDLERAEPRQAHVAECRLFLDMTMKEIAAALGISERTAHDDWAAAKEWLQKQFRK